MKIGLLGATFSTDNMGVSALTDGLLKSIYHQFKNTEVYLLDYAKQAQMIDYNFQNQHIKVPVINMRFSKKFYLKNNIAMLILFAILLKIVPGEKFKKRFISNNICLKTISESAMLASIAGGDSFSDIYGLRRYLYVALPQILIILMGIKLIILPQTLGPFKNSSVRIISRYILHHAYRVYSRDYTGIDYIRDLMGNKFDLKKFKFCYDVGFVIDAIKPENSEIINILNFKKLNKQLLGLNISGLLYRGGYTQDNMFGLATNYTELIHEIIDFAITKKDVQVLLIPHVFGSAESLESDSIACAETFEKLRGKYPDRLYAVSGQYNQNEIKYIIGLCDLFMGSRMHACIAAISQNIPSVALAYSRKFFGVMDSLGIGSIVADLRQMDKEDILKKIDKTFSERNEIIQTLEHTIPNVKKEVLNLFKIATA